MNPKEFRKFIYREQKELFAGFEKIKKDYGASKKTMGDIVLTDQRLHKLFCFKFWIVNYGFADGPIHDYYVEKLRVYAEKIAPWTQIEEKESVIQDTQRTLLQSDYIDLYLRNAFRGIEINKLLGKIPLLQKQNIMLIEYIRKNKLKESYAHIEAILNIIEENKNDEEIRKLRELLPFKTAQVRGDNVAIYNTVIHAMEFNQENIELKQRHDEMKSRINELMEIAKEKLSQKEFVEFKKCYEMSNLLKEAKDVFGAIDPYLLPLWFGMLEKLAKALNLPIIDDGPGIGHCAMFYLLVWHLPSELKANVFTPDNTKFILRGL